MENRNGVVYVTVRLQRRPEKINCAQTARSDSKKLRHHKSTVSLAIPSESSPRLLVVKEELALKELNSNFSSKKLQQPSQVRRKTSQHCNGKSAIDYYTNIYSLPDVDKLGPQTCKNSGLASPKSLIFPRRRPMRLVPNLKPK